MRNRGIRFRWRWVGETIDFDNDGCIAQDMFSLLPFLVDSCHSLPHISSRPRAQGLLGRPGKPSDRADKTACSHLFLHCIRIGNRTRGALRPEGKAFRLSHSKSRRPRTSYLEVPLPKNFPPRGRRRLTKGPSPATPQTSFSSAGARQNFEPFALAPGP